MRLIIATVVTWIVAIGLTDAVFSSPALATGIMGNDILLLIWFIITISCAMIVFASITGIWGIK